MYTSYKLTEKTKQQLLSQFPTKFQRVLADHVTVDFRVKKDSPVPPIADLKVVGYKSDDTGIEALVVSVNGSTKRSDGGTFHITWSLDPDVFKPKDSNDLLKRGDYTLVVPVDLSTYPFISH